MPESEESELETDPYISNLIGEDQPGKAVVNNVKDSGLGARAPLGVMDRTCIRVLIILVVVPGVWAMFMAMSWGYLHRLGVDDVLVSHVLLEGLKIWANAAIEFWKILISGLSARLFDGGIML